MKKVGNFFIVMSLVILLLTYYPILLLYLFPPTLQNITQEKGYFIHIPKIMAQAPIILDVDPWNETEYREKLTKGVAHAKGTSLPDKMGTSYLFAHSSDNPWSMSRYNTIFFRLYELTKNDGIIIVHDGNLIEYIVVDKKEVWPNEFTSIKYKNADLIVQTCTPLGTDLKRLLVFAEKRN